RMAERVLRCQIRQNTLCHPLQITQAPLGVPAALDATKVLPGRPGREVTDRPTKFCERTDVVVFQNLIDGYLAATDLRRQQRGGLFRKQLPSLMPFCNNRVLAVVARENGGQE